eukprot:CAMPEP_0114331996 /NCGR_PEP_ID=MMETSP0101-20121206/2784_1 /TAXON_ID=38822 ORGANISM="Pteridomonas danica, Strain PT" /NCGR_SAMPLE_ID=MMETSP0101 /ASSEMBLY_ACC=CAM_ASM_000211 /LENGTH=572 /DNA_ID=CAMNT_0001462515 /DNA_START=1507 /DNA_END=3225 /DNA_ORIENTATION=+
MHIQHRKHEWDEVANNCKRANIMYDRHLVLMPTFTGKHLLSPELQNRGKDAAWYLGTTPDTTYDRKRTPYPLPQTASHYLAPARVQVDKIAVTLLLMHSRDDPIVSHDDCYDWDRVASNKNIISLRTVRGGHLGWFDGLLPGMAVTTWGDRVVLDFLSAVLEQHAQTNFLVSVMRKSLEMTRPIYQGNHSSSIPSKAYKNNHMLYKEDIVEEQGEGEQEYNIQLGGISPQPSSSTNEFNDDDDDHETMKQTRDRISTNSMDQFNEFQSPNDYSYQNNFPQQHHQQQQQQTNHSNSSLPTFLSPGVFARICSTSDLSLPTAVIPTLQNLRRRSSAANLASNIVETTLLHQEEDDRDDNYYHHDRFGYDHDQHHHLLQHQQYHGNNNNNDNNNNHMYSSAHSDLNNNDDDNYEQKQQHYSVSTVSSASSPSPSPPLSSPSSSSTYYTQYYAQKQQHQGELLLQQQDDYEERKASMLLQAAEDKAKLFNKESAQQQQNSLFPKPSDNFMTHVQEENEEENEEDNVRIKSSSKNHQKRGGKQQESSTGYDIRSSDYYSTNHQHSMDDMALDESLTF